MLSIADHSSLVEWNFNITIPSLPNMRLRVGEWDRVANPFPAPAPKTRSRKRKHEE